MKVEGHLNAEGMKLALVVSRFNEFLVGKLLEGARDCLLRHGAAESDLTEIWVPGSFELPFAAQLAAASGRYDAVVCLGAVIRGGTDHYTYVAGEMAKGIARASKTLDGIQGAWINEQKVVCDGEDITEFRVTMKVTFILKD